MKVSTDDLRFGDLATIGGRIRRIVDIRPDRMGERAIDCELVDGDRHLATFFARPSATFEIVREVF